MARRPALDSDPFLDHRSSTGERFWRCRFWDPNTERWCRRALFNPRAPEARNPNLAPPELRNAWQKIRQRRLPTKAEARRRAYQVQDELEQSAEHDRVAQDTPITLRSLADREMVHPGKRGTRSEHTMIAIRAALRRFLAFMAQHYPRVELHAIRRLHVDEYLRYRKADGVSSSTVQRDLSYVRRMFELGVEMEWLHHNPCRGIHVHAPSIEVQRRDIREQALSEDEVERLLDACKNPYTTKARVRRRGSAKMVDMTFHPPRWLYPFVLVMLSSGCRRGEVLGSDKRNPDTGGRIVQEGLRWRDIDWATNRLRVDGKTGQKTVYVSDEALRALRTYRDWQRSEGLLQHDTAEVFVHEGTRKHWGKPIRNPLKVFHRAAERAGITRSVRIHDLRHTRGTQLALQGVPQAIIAKALGHRSSRTTEQYIHVADDHMIEQLRRAEGRE